MACIYISRSKNRSDRYSVLADRVVPILTDYIHQEYPDASKDDWLFPGQKPVRHITERSIYADELNDLIFGKGIDMRV